MNNKVRRTLTKIDNKENGKLKDTKLEELYNLTTRRDVLQPIRLKRRAAKDFSLKTPFNKLN